MRAVDIIIKKRGGGQLSSEEIAFFIDGYTRGEIPDYQAAAWAMAVFYQGLDAVETADLTMAMVRSGHQLDLSDIAPVVADKHSTGGVGDKTTMVVAPLVAAAGLPIGKMSGRGLGYFGGTIDKLETIPGFRASLTENEFRAALQRTGLVVAGQSPDMVPADGKLYALRDVTGTVESLPLIASSIMSKKIASGTNCIVLDVKHGQGAFMKSLEDATALAEAMTAIGRGLNRQVSAVLSSMEQPLGWAVGNTLEVREAVETLQGRGPEDLLELCFILGSRLLLMSGRAGDEAEARRQLRQSLDSGAAFEKYKAFVGGQGGDTSVLDDPDKLPRAAYLEDLPAPRSGYIQAINAEEVGIGAYTLGAGRKVKTDSIDPSAGLVLRCKVGDLIEAGAPLLQIHAASPGQADLVRSALTGAFTIGPDPVAAPRLVDLII